jgi:hypothetical protein
MTAAIAAPRGGAVRSATGIHTGLHSLWTGERLALMTAEE